MHVELERLGAMVLRQPAPRRRRDRRDRELRPCLIGLEQRVVPSSGITFDSSGDIYVSYASGVDQQAVAEWSFPNSRGFTNELNPEVFTPTSGTPGALATLQSAALPGTSAGDMLELLPTGQLYDFNAASGSSFQYDNLATDNANASKVFDIQTGATVDLSNTISVSNATFGDFGVYQNSLVIAGASNNWDFVMRVTYGASSKAATILVASPVSSGLTASLPGVAVDSQETVLTTLPYTPSGSSTQIYAPVEFNLFYVPGSSPAPSIPPLGLSSVPNIDSAAIAVDSASNFILFVTDSSLYTGGGPGVVHINLNINPALNPFLADPVSGSETNATAIATYQSSDGSYHLGLADSSFAGFTVAGELPLFTGQIQVTPAELRHAYGIDQISFTAPNGTKVTGDGSGQTIAIVEEGIDPTLEADLTTFDQFFGIPAPPHLKIMNQSGATENDQIIGEAALDVEWAHATAPGASIIVYNSVYDPNNAVASVEDLITAMHTASELTGVSVVTLSYGLDEGNFDEQALDSNFTTANVTFLAAAGDDGAFGDGSTGGYAVLYPAASPNVVAVGGTSIVIDAAGDYPGTGSNGEVAWNDGGGGLSNVELEPSWQEPVVSASTVVDDGYRAVPDVSMDSGAAQEYDVFTSTSAGSSVSADAVGWLGDAGTSAGSPIWAGLIAIADQGRALEHASPLTGYSQTLPALYALPSSDFHDIVNGYNGYSAEPGYDLASGLGTPVANLLVPALAGYQIPTTMSIKSEPPSNVGVAPQTFGLTVQVGDSLGNLVTGSTVTVGLGQSPAGATLGGTVTQPVINGYATFNNLTLSPAGSYTLTVTDSDLAGKLTTSLITVSSGSLPTATLGLSDLSYTYNGLSHAALVTTNPPGLSGVTITYSQNGVDVANPTHAGIYTVMATLDNPNYEAQPVTGTLVIAKVTPTITWANPANITVGTPLGAAQLDASASFGGGPLTGAFNYSPGAGAQLPTGDGQTLTVNFLPADSTDFNAVTAYAKINVVPQSPPPPPTAMVIGEAPVFKRLLNKKGKPTGKVVLTGFTLDFNTPLSVAAATNPGNFELETVATVKVKKKVERVLQAVTSFTVTYTPASESVTIGLRSGQSFPKGGRLVVFPGVTSGSGAVLGGTTLFTITAGGKKIEP
jgi:hypothetical protein